MGVGAGGRGRGRSLSGSVGKGIMHNLEGGRCHNKVIGEGYISLTFAETYKDD